MGSKALSETQVRNLKPRSTPFKVSDGGGLHVLVSPTGGKLWRQAYRFRKKQHTLALGAYPAVSLADARKGREQAKRDLAAGRDPAIAKQEHKRLAARGAASSFAKVAEEWFDKRKEPWGEGHRKRVWGSIENDVIPTFQDVMRRYKLVKRVRQDPHPPALLLARHHAQAQAERAGVVWDPRGYARVADGEWLFFGPAKA